MAHTRAAALAAQLQADLDVDLDSPIDVFAAIRSLGIVLAFGNLDKASGVYLPSRNRSPAGILLHQGHPMSRQRFTAGHELGHHMFNHGAEVDGDIDSLMRQGYNVMPDIEKEAEAFAAWFLMPRRLLRAGVRELGLSLGSPDEVYTLSLWLGTSYLATVRQLVTTRMLDQARGDSWAVVSPKSIKLGLTGGRDIDDFRNDVWRLTEASNQHPISARRGDRLLLQLEESASTGYSWIPSELPAGVEIVSDSFRDHWEPADNPPSDSRNEPPGQPSRRSILMAISPSVSTGIHRMALSLARPWKRDSAANEFEILVSVSESLRGMQLSEDELRVRT